MPKKHESDLSLSQEENEKIQQIQEHIAEIAGALHNSSDNEQAEATLTAISRLSEPAQLVLLKVLSKEHDTDAADILLAMNELSPVKALRKEARRSLIRLEEAKIHPTWMPAATRTPVIQLPTENRSRFWKGFVTQAREEGEIQLILCWEQGYDYNEVRMLVFLLDFWEQGVKDFFIENTTKRGVETQIQTMRSQLKDITIADCTLAEGHRLLEEALAVNTWRGTTPHKEYRLNLPTVKHLVLNNEDVGEDRALTFINPKLEPDEVAATFVGAWTLGDYGLTYDLLTQESGLKEGMTRDEWLEHHYSWAKEAKPTRFVLGFVHEVEAAKPALWLPSSFSSKRVNTGKDIEIGWSVELSDTPLSGTLREMPMGTIVNKQTGRHWFLTKYSLVQEQDLWRISQMTDEGANLQTLSVPELEKQVKEYDEQIQDIMQKTQEKSPESMEAIEDIIWRMDKALSYDDALIFKHPSERLHYEDAYSRCMSLNFTERALAYLDRMAQRFTEKHDAILNQIGVLQEEMSMSYHQHGMDERSKQFSRLAIKTLRHALTVEDNMATHALLAEILIRRGENLEEAETHLRLAQAMATTPTEKAVLESDSGNVNVERGQIEDALRHYQKAAELDPDLPDIWFRVGYMQRNLKRFDEAKVAYEQAIDRQPNDIRPYSELTAIYMNEEQFSQARDILDRGLRVNPGSPHLLALLASVLAETGEMRRAESVLKEAEQIAPDLEIVQAVREEFNKAKKK